MKIITDFDGTLTNIQYEYDYQHNVLMKSLLEVCNNDQALLDSIFEEVVEYVDAQGDQHGWQSHGRITAFSDEDLFMRLSAYMACLEGWLRHGHGRVIQIHDRVKALGHSLSTLADHAHQEINLAPLCDFNTPEPEAVTAIRSLLAQDYEVVIVSNSPASRIVKKLEYVGLKPVDHEANPSAQFRVRGHAGKFVLDVTPELVTFGSRQVDVARSGYRAIIEQERPHAIVGDVFSLDLALPVHMSCQEPKVYDGLQLYLRMRSYTPQWAVDCALNPPSEAAATLGLLNHYTDLESLLRRNR
ncbi:MAG: hypothetical protein FWC40_04015 [Proteobacteria bacterium]|nr:hypothetical protein [Pseudomonadota bacterium]